MALELPAAVEPYVGTDYHSPAVYCLALDLPRDLPRAWDAEYETRPDYVDRASEARQVLYVGATADLLSRLEDHRDGAVRTATLVSLAEGVTLREVWPFADADRAFERESGIALELAGQSSSRVYVHQR